MCGKGLTFGVGPVDLLPQAAVAPGCYALNMDVVPHGRTSICDDRLSVVADGSLDWVFVGERFRSIKDPEKLLKALHMRLRVGGHMIVGLPIGGDDLTAKQYTPNCMRRMIADVGSWQIKDAIERDGWMLQIYKKLNGRRGVYPGRTSTKPRACVVRYGAMGDMIMVSPLLRRLHEDGYEVTVNATPYSTSLLENNPYVDNILHQEREAIPNRELGPYWDEWKPQYDRYINLSESIEGTLLKVEGRREFYTHKDWRHRECNKNYYDFTMERGGYPNATDTRGEVFLSPAEDREAQRTLDDLGGDFTIVWALNGTSHHKVYPMMEPVLKRWFETHPKSRAITVGNDIARLMEFDHPQVRQTAGTQSIRTSVALAKHADLVIGPESVMINAAGCWATPKIPLLSHSTHENLCKNFENDYCLAPNVALAPCYPCHQLKYSLESCPSGLLKIDEVNEVVARGPICAMGAIEPDRLLARMDEVYAAKYTN
jgi:ADP-heptose:LPS heptosyltransferase